MLFANFSLTFLKKDEKILENTYKNLSIENNKIVFNLFDYNTCLDIKNQIFTRENEDFIFKLDILKEKCTIFLKQENVTVDVAVDYAQFQMNEREIQLEYMIETDDQKNKIIIKNLGDINE